MISAGMRRASSASAARAAIIGASPSSSERMRSAASLLVLYMANSSCSLVCAYVRSAILDCCSGMVEDVVPAVSLASTIAADVEDWSCSRIAEIGLAPHRVVTVASPRQRRRRHLTRLATPLDSRGRLAVGHLGDVFCELGGAAIDGIERLRKAGRHPPLDLRR
jgi:hypothetical protein